MRFRSWIVTTIVIGIAQAVLSLLLVLQHDALYSELLRQRVSVIAQTTAETFRPILDLGLPISMLRGGDAIVARGIDIDPNIVAVHAINPSGVVVHTTGPKPRTLSNDLMFAMRLADGDFWGHETQDFIYSGFSIRSSRNGPVSGAVVVEYPHHPLDQASSNIVRITLRNALLIFVCTSALAYVSFHLVLGRPRRRHAEFLSRYASGAEQSPAERLHPSQERGAVDSEYARLEQSLQDAKLAYDTARRAIAAPETAAPVTAPDPVQLAPQKDLAAGKELKTLIMSRVLPITILLLVVSSFLIMALTMRAVTRSIEPELAARTNLIGTVVSENVQRALDSGVALDEIVGADSFFGDMLERLPEVSYIAVATGRIVIEAGERIDPYLAPPRERRGVRSHPILHAGEEVAYVIIDIDPRLISQRFRGAFLDAAVILLVTVLLAWETMLLLTGRTLTGGLSRLQRLSGMQAAGDFSRRVVISGQSSIHQLLRDMSRRAEDLHVAFAEALKAANGRSRPALEDLGRRFGLSPKGPRPLETSSFADIRLALFLFAAADELPLAFLPLYTRSADNLWPWLDTSILISLPLAGYLLAIVVMSPYARVLVERFGVRALFLAATIPTLAAHVGIFAATTAQEIILWRTVTGLGYALVTLAAQDYVLGVTPKDGRDRILGVFTLVLFGGIFAGVAIGGVLADRLGPANVFLVSASLIAASALLSVWLIAPEIGRSRMVGAAAPDRAAKWRALTDLRLASLILGIAIPGAVVLQAFVSYLVALTLDAQGASSAETGRILMLYFLAIMVVSPLAGQLTETLRVPGTLLCLAGAALSGLSLLPVAAAPSQATMALAMIGAGTGGALVRGTQVSLALRLAETDLSQCGPAAVLGALRTGERLGSIIGLVLMAVIAGAADYQTATIAIAAWSLGGAVLYGIMLGTGLLTGTRSSR
ncbi:MFS transporter [Ruegeria marina]|uniref:Predicted arabinose efflux permease, MFS family n=1 Tax=Ruegeria marina TaxID=639004 RepID=A0A1G6VHN6_9RHOB|nr:MFS transporter [Ruegeria marina]SDD53049.1 Predicted arabinose efflux permease, MFS family [Ruegeria marina]